MRNDILKYLQQEIYDRCQKETNEFGMGCYYHISSVVQNAEILAGEYGADKEIVMIAAWLHDIASITDYWKRCGSDYLNGQSAVFFIPASNAQRVGIK